MGIILQAFRPSELRCTLQILWVQIQAVRGQLLLRHRQRLRCVLRASWHLEKAALNNHLISHLPNALVNQPTNQQTD